MAAITKDINLAFRVFANGPLLALEISGALGII